MIVPDLNLTIYAYNTDAPHHAAARRWWEDALSGAEPVGVAWMVALGFVRLMSDRRVLVSPMTPGEALGHVSKWFAQPICQTLAPGPAHLRILGTLLGEGQASSRLVTDAHLAALAIEHQAELHSNDSDFARFSGLKWINPISRY